MPCEKHTRFSDPDVSPGERKLQLEKQKKELQRRREAEQG
jgi:hypothetical protein